MIALDVSDADIARRLQEEAPRATAPFPGSERGYLKLFLEHVTQADQGCDFDFLRAVAMTQKAPARK